MKTFLNVLYRRILYKIPLKFLLILVVIFGLLFACFSNADFYYTAGGAGVNLNAGERYQLNRFITQQGLQPVDNIICVSVGDASANLETSAGVHVATINQHSIYCRDYTKDYYVINSSVGQYILLFANVPGLGEYLNPNYTSLECQTEYSLIPVSSVDSEYCEDNNLCSSSDFPSYTGDLVSGVSNIFINDIFHPGAFNVIMNIPQEIDWDYAYTNSGQNLNIDVVGYNVDYEKMQSVIDLQNYKPTDEDFSEIIGVLAPYSKIIIFFVVLFSLWAMIKKPFKSKKL